MKNDTLIQNLFKTQSYCGHKKQFRNPKLKSFIYKTINKLDFIDLDKTVIQIENCKKIINQYSSDDILIISSLSKDFKYNSNVNVVTKWKPGMLTNFSFSKLNKKPKLLIIERAFNNKIALKEANICGVKTIGFCDTNSSLVNVDFPIIINDDSRSSTELVMNFLFD